MATKKTRLRLVWLPPPDGSEELTSDKSRTKHTQPCRHLVELDEREQIVRFVKMTKGNLRKVLPEDNYGKGLKVEDVMGDREIRHLKR